MTESSHTTNFVITCGDEGVQLNEGTRLSFVGSGVKLEGFSTIVPVLKEMFGSNLKLASSQENDWIKQQFDLHTWEQADATYQQQAEALADREGLKYVGYLSFQDPRQLAEGIKGHMVRPRKVHVANKISFTLAGGEQAYSLGNYQISAEWLSQVDYQLAASVIKTQVEFYQQLSKLDLQFKYEEAGFLGEEVARQNRVILEKILR